MKERLAKLLEKESLARNEFASKIGVQRSNITHILDGRNKPSYDFILKTLEAFPSLNAEWLIQGTGLMYKERKTGTLFPETASKKEELGVKQESQDTPKENTSEPTPIKPTEDIPKIDESKILLGDSDKNIERIVILYTDKSFDVYKN